VNALGEASPRAQAGVQHAAPCPDRPSVSPAAGAASCAHCGGHLPTGAWGRPRPGTRYCSPRCRHAATRERRAAARADLPAAIAELRRACDRVERAVRAQGLYPQQLRKR